MKIKAIILPASQKCAREKFKVTEKLGDVDTHIDFFKTNGALLWPTPIGAGSYNIDKLQNLTKGYFYESDPIKSIRFVFDVEYFKVTSDIHQKDLKFIPDFRIKHEYDPDYDYDTLGWVKIIDIKKLKTEKDCSDFTLYSTDKPSKRIYTQRTLLVNYKDFPTKNI